jgi:LCP family protein required for cell wall assembly
VGRPRSALLYAAPPLIAVLVVAAQAANGIQAFGVSLLTPSVGLTALALVVLLCIWRLLSMADAFGAVGHGYGWRRPSAVAGFLVLSALVVAVHAPLVAGTISIYNFGRTVFTQEPPGSDGGTAVVETPDRSTPEPGSTPTPTPAMTDPWTAPSVVPTPATSDARITILLTGIDRSKARTSAGTGGLTDTMLVATFDPKTRTVSMVNFPRDIAYFPLYNGRTYTDKLNTLMSWANKNTDRYPDGGMGTLMKQLGFLLGTPIHYYAAVDLDGMRKMVDIVGGINVYNSKEINDPTYQFRPDDVGFHLPVGFHHLTGERAMAYMRSRHGRGNSDFDRARRQQETLIALRAKLTDPSMFLRLPQVLDTASQAIRTNFPSARLSELMQYAEDVDPSSISRFVLSPPDFATHPPTSSTGGVYTLELDLDAVAELSRELYGADSTYDEDSAPGEPTEPDPGDYEGEPGSGEDEGDGEETPEP